MPVLHWLTRGEDIRAAGAVPYRLFEEAPELGFGMGVAPIWSRRAFEGEGKVKRGLLLSIADWAKATVRTAVRAEVLVLALSSGCRPRLIGIIPASNIIFIQSTAHKGQGSQPTHHSPHLTHFIIGKRPAEDGFLTV